MAGKSFFRSATLTALGVLFSSGAFAAPNIGQMFVINGRLMFTIDTGSFVLQRKYGENWITQSGLYNGDGYWYSSAKDYSGLVEIRFGYSADGDDWNVRTIDARHAVAPVAVWDLCNHGGYYNPPQGAVDGIPGTMFHIPDQGDEDHAIYLDLGSPRKLTGGAALSRNGFTGRIGTAVFEGSSVSNFASDVVTLYQIPEGNTFANRYASFEFTTTATVQYVRFRPNGGTNVPGWDGWFNVDEVEFCEQLSDFDFGIDSFSLSDGVISSMQLSFSDADGTEQLYVAYGANPHADGGMSAWDGYALSSVSIAAGDSSVAFDEFPSGWGEGVDYLRLFATDANGNIIKRSDIIAFDGNDFPVFFPTFGITGNTYGDTVLVSGSLLSAGSGDSATVVTVETSSSNSFASPSVWSATLGAGFGCTAYLRDPDPESSSYLEAGTTVYARFKAVDGNGHAAYSDTFSIALGSDFNKGPQFLAAPSVINGRLCVPLSGGRASFFFQKLADDGQTWQTMQNFGEHYTDIYCQDLTLRGVSSWRVAYVPTAPGVSEPYFWTYFDINARYPVFGKTLCVGGVYDGNISVDGAYDGYRFSYYEPNSSAYNTENMWIGVDFGTVRTITSIAFARRPSDNYCVGANFEYASDADFTDAQSFYTIPDPGDDGAKVVTLETPVSARYFRVKKPLGGWFNIGEIEYSVAANDAELEVASQTGFPDGVPVVSVSGTFSSDYGFCVYRSRKPDGFFVRVATLAGGVTQYVDDDETIGFGNSCYYRVARRDSNGEALAQEASTVG
ncbi:MAG: discoidin domain-containing protein, partial [Kiritimatiellae bacterium]|nr:discoidin domain-containing protein [Kiritimatiellia bacterium]